MSLPGWYPDPGGAPDRYRYFDGTTWSGQTATDPRQPPPGAGPTAAEPTRRRSPAGLIAALALLLVLALAAAVVIARSPGRSESADSYPSPTVSGWDDSSPTAPPPSPTPAPTPSPSASGSPSPGQLPCPVGKPSGRASHPRDGRVYGGNLSFAAETSYDPPAVEHRFSFAHDVAQQSRRVNQDPAWIAQLAVGQLRARDGFTRSAHRTAEQVAQCSISSNLYLPYGPTRTDERSEPFRVGGRQGWLIETDVTVAWPGLPFPGDHVVLIVVPDGRDWGLFFGAVPIGDAGLEATLTRAIGTLTLA